MSITYPRQIFVVNALYRQKQTKKMKRIKVMFLNKWMLGLKKVETEDFEEF